MCGIAGIIYKKNQHGRIQNELEQMLNLIVHRGPDGLGTKFFDSKIALGHRRLAILDLTDDGLQPMSIDQRVWITFNGEIYNYIELRKELEQVSKC